MTRWAASSVLSIDQLALQLEHNRCSESAQPRLAWRSGRPADALHSAPCHCVKRAASSCSPQQVRQRGVGLAGLGKGCTRSPAGCSGQEGPTAWISSNRCSCDGHRRIGRGDAALWPAQRLRTCMRLHDDGPPPSPCACLSTLHSQAQPGTASACMCVQSWAVCQAAAQQPACTLSALPAGRARAAFAVCELARVHGRQQQHHGGGL